MMRGFVLLEILVALAIMSIAMLAISLLAFGLPFMSRNAQMRLDALSHAENLLSQASHDSQADSSTLSVTASTSTTTSDSVYTYFLSTESLEDESFSKLTSMVTWVDLFHTSQTVIQSRVIGDANIQDTACDPFVSGDWNHPVVTNTYSVPGDIAEIFTTPKNVFVALASTTTATAPTLLSYNVSGTSSPLLANGFDNASSSRIGFSSVTSKNGFVFAGNTFTSSSMGTCNDGVSCAQIQTFSVGSTGSLARAGALTLSTSSAPFALSANGLPAPVSTLTYYHQYLYVGLQKTIQGDEFSIIDARDPSHLVWRSGYRVGRTVNHITVRGSTAYLSTDDPTRELILLDIRDPDHPTLLGSWDAPGNTSFGYGADSTVHGSYIRFGRSYSSNASEFSLLDASDPLHIHSVQDSDSGTTRDPESVRSMLTQEQLTYVLLSHRLEFWNISSPQSLTSFATSYALPTGSAGISLACRNNFLYVGRNTVSGGMVDVLQGS